MKAQKQERHLTLNLREKSNKKYPDPKAHPEIINEALTEDINPAHKKVEELYSFVPSNSLMTRPLITKTRNNPFRVYRELSLEDQANIAISLVERPIDIFIRTDRNHFGEKKSFSLEKGIHFKNVDHNKKQNRLLPKLNPVSDPSNHWNKMNTKVESNSSPNRSQIQHQFFKDLDGSMDDKKFKQNMQLSKVEQQDNESNSTFNLGQNESMGKSFWMKTKTQFNASQKTEGGKLKGASNSKLVLLTNSKNALQTNSSDVNSSSNKKSSSKRSKSTLKERDFRPNGFQRKATRVLDTSSNDAFDYGYENSNLLNRMKRIKESTKMTDLSKLMKDPKWKKMTELKEELAELAKGSSANGNKISRLLLNDIEASMIEIGTVEKLRSLVHGQQDIKVGRKVVYPIRPGVQSVNNKMNGLLGNDKEVEDILQRVLEGNKDGNEEAGNEEEEEERKVQDLEKLARKREDEVTEQDDEDEDHEDRRILDEELE